jgi:alkylhydroperoxidase family enzyme
MTRLAMAPVEPADAALKKIFDDLRAARGPGFLIPNLYRVLGRAPAMLRAWLDFAWPLRLQASSSRQIRELLILRGAQVSETNYEWVHHVPMALAAGVTQQQVEALAAWQGSDLFTAQEKAVIRLAEEVMRGPAASAACIDELKHSFSDAEVVELVLTASFYVCVGRFLKSMDVDLEPGFEALRPGANG